MNSEKDLEIARWSDLVKALQVEVTEARKEAQYYKEKWPTALDLTIRERLTAQVEAAIEKRDREREDHMTAAMLVAKMHAAAVGEVTGPRRSVVEDVEDLRSERDDLQRRLDATRMYVNAHPGSYLSRSQQDVWLHELRVVLFASASDNQQESNGEVVPYGAGAGCKPAVSDPGGSIPPLSTDSPAHQSTEAKCSRCNGSGWRVSEFTGSEPCDECGKAEPKGEAGRKRTDLSEALALLHSVRGGPHIHYDEWNQRCDALLARLGADGGER